MNSLGIKAFSAVVRFGSITKAAQSLFLSQSTVSHRLSLLEDELNVKLIERKKGTRNISLTSEGEKFLKIAFKWEELVREAEKIKLDQSKSTLTIGAVDSINAYILGVVYEHIQNHSSSLNLRVRTHQSSELYSLVEHKDVDVAFTLSERSMKNINVETFFEEPMVLIMNSNKHNYQKYPISNSQLNPKFEIYIDWGANFRIWHEKWWESETFQNIQIDTAQLLLKFINKPKNWAIVPVSIAKYIINVKPISIYYLEDPPPNRVCYRIQARTSNNPTALEIFNKVLKLKSTDIKSIIQL